MDKFSKELEQLRQDLKDGAISRTNYDKAVKYVLRRRDVYNLPPLWWTKYTLKDAPVSWMNPHFESIWAQASPNKQDIALMAIGVLKESNSRIRAAKYLYTNDRMKDEGVYTGLSVDDFIHGGVRAMQVATAAVMEVFTPTGLYAVPQLES